MGDLLILLTGVEEILRGISPYGGKFYSPPWIALLLAPLIPVPWPESYGAYLIFALAALAFVAWRLKWGPAQTILIALAIPVFGSIGDGNIDVFCIAGAFMHPVIGYPLLLLKPQIGIGMVVYWLVEGKVRETWLLVILILVSLACFPEWPGAMMSAAGNEWNFNIWPHSLLVGLPLLAHGIREKKPLYALAAGPLLSPYCTQYSIAAVLPLVITEWTWAVPVYELVFFAVTMIGG